MSGRRLIKRFQGKEALMTTKRFRPLLASVPAVTVAALLLVGRGSAQAPREEKLKTIVKKTTNHEVALARPVAWFEVAGKGGARLRSFYGELFGWKTHDVAPGADYGVTDRPTSGIGGGVGAVPTGGPGHVTFFIEVEDIDASLREAERLGGKTISGPRTFPDKRPSSHGRGTVTFAYFADPEGHLIGLCSGIEQP